VDKTAALISRTRTKTRSTNANWEPRSCETTNTGSSDPAQLRRRIVWKDDRPFIVHVEDDNATHITPLISVPDVLWRSPLLWDAPIPYWAKGVPPPELFLAMLLEIDGRRRTAIARLGAIVALLRETRRSIADGADASEVAALVDVVKTNAVGLYRELDAR
jgi:hypothetical protein